jgi:hypothetical protein
LITYEDMKPKVLPAFIERTQAKYDDRFIQLSFDSGAELSDSLRDAVRKISDEDKLKIFISGHGGTGIQYITDDSQNRKQTVDDIAQLLRIGLSERATSRAASADTEVNMVSCLFGRTPDGRVDGSPAVCLHRKLCAWDIYVDLVARTESVLCMATGRQTVSALDHKINVPIYGKKPRFYKAKTQFSKIRCTYRDGAPVVLLKDYEADSYIESDSRQGRRILWADNVVNEFVNYIQPARDGEVTDVRQQTLHDLVVWYDNFHNPEVLKQKMDELISGQGGGPGKDFTTDRGIGILNPFRLPKTARLVKRLIDAYPV